MESGLLYNVPHNLLVYYLLIILTYFKASVGCKICCCYFKPTISDPGDLPMCTVCPITALLAWSVCLSLWNSSKGCLLLQQLRNYDFGGIMPSFRGSLRPSLLYWMLCSLQSWQKKMVMSVDEITDIREGILCATKPCKFTFFCGSIYRYTKASKL